VRDGTCVIACERARVPVCVGMCVCMWAYEFVCVRVSECVRA